MLKDRVPEIDDFLDAVRRDGRGGSAIDSEIVAHLVGRRPAVGLVGTSDDHRRVRAVLTYLNATAGPTAWPIVGPL